MHFSFLKIGLPLTVSRILYYQVALGGNWSFAALPPVAPDRTRIIAVWSSETQLNFWVLMLLSFKPQSTSPATLTQPVHRPAKGPLMSLASRNTSTGVFRNCPLRHWASLVAGSSAEIVEICVLQK
jgi:hypothetical protein